MGAQVFAVNATMQALGVAMQEGSFGGDGEGLARYCDDGPKVGGWGHWAACQAKSLGGDTSAFARLGGWVT